MGRVGLQSGRGHVQFYPYEMGGGVENVLAMLKFWDHFYMVA